ncbi:MAG TPA: hypothetical protein VH682_27150 [Gemmataceae bacterium]|jgi:hypothetical protein
MPSFFLTPAAKGKRIVLWTLVCFAVSQLALSIYLEKRRPEVRDPLYGLRLSSLRAKWAESPSSPLFLILGSSRVKYSVWPTAMKIHGREGGPPPVVYNFGVNGLGPIRELMYLRRLLADGVRPDWLLVEVWPPLWPEAGFFRESRMVVGEDDLRWRDVPFVCRYYRKEWAVLHYGLRKWLLPISDYRGRLLEANANELLPRAQADETAQHVRDWLPEDGTGWFPLPWGAATAEGRQRAIEHGAEEMKPLVDPLKIDPRSDSSLRELLAECRRHNIKAALILMPEHSRTRGWYPPQALALMQQYLARLKQDYPVPIVDTRRWAPDKDFADYCHMDTGGVPAFSERLGREVVQPLIEDKPLSASVLFNAECRMQNAE